MLLKNLLLIIATVIFLTSCAGQRVKTEYKYQEVATPVSCITWHPKEPEEVFPKLPPNSPLVEQVKALIQDLESWKSYAEALVLSQKPCNIDP